MSDDVFISYRREDSGADAHLIKDRLSQRFGRDNVFMDVHNIKLSQNFKEELKARLSKCRILIAVIGRNWGPARLHDDHDFVRVEIQTALKRRIPVIPVLVSGASMPAVEALPQAIRSLPDLQRLEVEHSRFDSDIQRLIDAVSSLIGPLLPEPEPPSSAGATTGELTLVAVLKGSVERYVDPAFPTGRDGAHFVFDLFNPNKYDIDVQKIHAEVLSYETANLEYLAHGVGATDVIRRFRVDIPPKSGSYVAEYVGAERQGEYVKILSEASDQFDVEVSANVEGIYDVCFRIIGSCAGKRIDALIETTRKEIVFFDTSKPYMVDRGLGGEMLPFEVYAKEMANNGRQGR
jgi:hypothetical protein